MSPSWAIPRRLPSAPGVISTLGVGLAGLATAALALEGLVTAASARAEEFLAALAGVEATERLSPSTRFREANSLAQLALATGLPHTIADEALRVAANAAFERLVELERSARDLLAVETMTHDDAVALGEYRLRFVARHRDVLARLRPRLEVSARERLLSSWAGTDPGAFTVVCAWCLSVRDTDDAWLPLAHLLPTTPALPVTHTICPSCRFSEFTPGDGTSGQRP